MYRRFLNDNDYLSVISPEALSQITRGNAERLAQAEESAEMSIVEYLSENYEIEQELGKGLHQAVFLLPYSMAGFLDTLHQNAKVLNVSYEASGIAVEAIVDEVLYGRLSAYRKE